MKVDRKEFLAKLNTVGCAAQSKETLEQSNCVIFSGGKIIAFNGEIYAEVEFLEMEKDFAVASNDLITLLSRIPDDEIGITIDSEQLKITGKRKRAGLTIQQEILLPFGDVPVPKKYKKAEKTFLNSLKMAAKVCETNGSTFRTSHVSITADKIQATDRYRFLCISGSTGIDNLLVPAESINLLNSIEMTGISVNKGWLFLKAKAEKAVYGLCCATGEYFAQSDLDGILALEEGSKIKLPTELATAITRAGVMAEAGMNKNAEITLEKNALMIRTQKDSGWYEEKQKVQYSGTTLKVTVSLSLFSDLLSKNEEALINEEKIKMQKDNLEFVVALEQ